LLTSQKMKDWMEICPRSTVLHQKNDGGRIINKRHAAAQFNTTAAHVTKTAITSGEVVPLSAASYFM
jgi:hypothetical protein